MTFATINPRFSYMADELTPANFPQGELLFYTSKDGKVKMKIRVECETIWATQQLSELNKNYH